MFVPDGRVRTDAMVLGSNGLTVPKTEIIKLVAAECDAFVERFFQSHFEKIQDLDVADVNAAEQRFQWHDLYGRFVEEAELTLQNAMMLWGLTIERKFEEEFLELAQNSVHLDPFLGLTDYAPFIAKAHQYVLHRQHARAQEPRPEELPSRPTTPHSHQATGRRLSSIDQRLAQLEHERNELLVERRRLVGCSIAPTTWMSLKEEIERGRWKDEVGND